MLTAVIVPESVVAFTDIKREETTHCEDVEGVTVFNVITGAGETPSNSNAPRSGLDPVPE